MGKEKIVVLGCSMAMDDICIGCSRCMVGFNRREGEFKNCNEDAELVGIVGCGGCPGSGIVTRMAHMKLWNGPMTKCRTKSILLLYYYALSHKDVLLKRLRPRPDVKSLKAHILTSLKTFLVNNFLEYADLRI